MTKRMKKSTNSQRSAIVTMCVLGLLVVSSGSFAAAESVSIVPAETRCGWFSNPTPANASLYDREDEWIISVQGGHQADGDWPEFGKGQWVETNGHHGYGCACMQVNVDRNEHRVIKILSATAKSLATCRRDTSLKRWGFK